MALPSTGYATADVTNPGSALTDFTLMVDLSRMPTSWWSEVDTSDGTKGRAAKDDATELATDWIDFDDTAETGWLRVKWSGTLASSGTQTLRVYPPVTGNSSNAPSATYGSDNAYKSEIKAYWPLDSDFNDRTSNSHDLTETSGTIPFVSGQVGNGADFELSETEWLETADTADLDPGDVDYMMSCWVKLESKPGSDDMNIITKDDGSSDRQYRLQWDNGNDRFQFFAFTSANNVAGGVLANNLGAPSLGTWYHIVAWHSATDNEVGIRVNGGTADTSATSAAAGTGGSKFYIGSRVDLSKRTYFDGVIDDVFFRHELYDADEVQQEYDQTSDQATFWGTWSWNSGGGGGSIIPQIMHHRRMMGVS